MKYLDVLFYINPPIHQLIPTLRLEPKEIRHLYAKIHKQGYSLHGYL